MRAKGSKGTVPRGQTKRRKDGHRRGARKQTLTWPTREVSPVRKLPTDRGFALMPLKGSEWRLQGAGRGGLKRRICQDFPPGAVRPRVSPLFPCRKALTTLSPSRALTISLWGGRTRQALDSGAPGHQDGGVRHLIRKRGIR